MFLVVLVLVIKPLSHVTDSTRQELVVLGPRRRVTCNSATGIEVETPQRKPNGGDKSFIQTNLAGQRKPCLTQPLKLANCGQPIRCTNYLSSVIKQALLKPEAPLSKSPFLERPGESGTSSGV